jgi:hypothetical protein
VSTYDEQAAEKDLSAALIRECEALEANMRQVIENRDQEESR